MPSYRMGGGGRFRIGNLRGVGQNHPGGVMVHYFLKEKPADSVEVKISFHEMDGDLIKEYSSKAKEKRDKIELKEGGNSFNWNMNYPDGKKFKGMIFWAGSLTGPKAVPGKYKVKLAVGDQEMEQEFEILKDPRSESTQEDFIAQFEFCKEVVEKATEAHEAIIDIRNIRKQLKEFTKDMDDEEMKDIISKTEEINKKMGKVEKALYQTKNQSRQDPLNFPIRLTNKLAHLNSLTRRGNFAPTKQAKQVKEELTDGINQNLSKFYEVKQKDIPELNQMIKDKALDLIRLEEKKEVN